MIKKASPLILLILSAAVFMGGCGGGGGGGGTVPPTLQTIASENPYSNQGGETPTPSPPPLSVSEESAKSIITQTQVSSTTTGYKPERNNVGDKLLTMSFTIPEPCQNIENIQSQAPSLDYIKIDNPQTGECRILVKQNEKGGGFFIPDDLVVNVTTKTTAASSGLSVKRETSSAAINPISFQRLSIIEGNTIKKITSQ